MMIKHSSAPRPEGNRVTTQTVPLAHDVRGSGPLVVAVHGITENRTYWDRVPLADAFRVIRVDLRGHGESPRTAPYDPETSVADVHDLVEQLAPGETPLVVGHSFGGVIASAYASRHAVRGVVVVDQTLKVSPLPPELVDTLHGDGFEDFLRGLFAQLRGDLDEAVAAEVEAHRTLHRDVLLGNWAPLLNLDADGLDRWIDGILDLPESLPYLSVHGFDPGEEYAAWLRKRVPNALVEVAPVATHYPHLADPDWFLDRLVAFDEGATTR